MNKFTIIICFILGFGAVFVYRYIRTPKSTPSTRAVESTTQSTPQPTLELLPPAQALSGVLTVLSGTAEVYARNTDAYAEASSGAKILIGESVATKENSSAKITIDNMVTTTMGESAELVFANLFTSDMLLQQKMGQVTYQLVDGVPPVGIRVLHSLVSVRSGEATIHIVDTDVSVSVRSGSVKLAQVDSDNNTHIWELQEGQRANIDDAARKVTILKAR